MWRYLTQFHEFLHFWLDFWLDVDPDPLLARILARCRSRCVFGSIFGSMSISVRCAGPRLGSCNFVTPKLGFLQLKWMLAVASRLNICKILINFQKITTFFRSTGVISRIWHTTHKGRTLLLVFYQKKMCDFVLNVQVL